MSSDRPNPLGEVASKVGTAWSVAAGLVGALVTYGFLSTAQAGAINAAGSALPDTITGLGTVIAGIVPLIGGVVASFRTATAGREHVTPVSSPRDNDGNRLTLDDPAVVRPPDDSAGYR